MLTIYLALIDEPSDKEKFTAVYNLYKNMMFRKAMSILHNESIAEEAVQESFLKVAKNISKISSPDCIQTRNFIVIIVRNTSLDMLKGERGAVSDELDEDIPDMSMNVLNKVISDDGYEYLLRLIDDLDDIYSDALTLKLVMGYSSEEISEMLDVPKNTVISRVSRGKRILQKKLEEYYGEEMH
ncbi:MAG: sigma-70 family RNA polymerase sigma factor [Ruminococcus sp.]|nr:sigma-70 family RNA polymerase sigma factor [Ruminococcus sp.]